MSDSLQELFRIQLCSLLMNCKRYRNLLQTVFKVILYCVNCMLVNVWTFAVEYSAPVKCQACIFWNSATYRKQFMSFWESFNWSYILRFGQFQLHILQNVALQMIIRGSFSDVLIFFFFSKFDFLYLFVSHWPLSFGKRLKLFHFKMTAFVNTVVCGAIYTSCVFISTEL